MGNESDKRANYRRFSDRRAALLLEVYEALFNNASGVDRDRLVLEAIRDNYEADRAAFVKPRTSSLGSVEVVCAAGAWKTTIEGRELAGPGLRMLLDLHQAAPGTLTFSRVKQPSAFSTAAWQHLWTSDLGAQTMALLSISIEPKTARPYILWLQQSGYSREWSSRDRELAEEIANILGISADRALKGC